MIYTLKAKIRLWLSRMFAVILACMGIHQKQHLLFPLEMQLGKEENLCDS